MELEFQKSIYPCLQQVKWEVQNTEQTQEVRVGDSMPDIGRVLGAWGQVLLRGKEWRSGGMSVSGGVLVWVLYVPEDGGDPQCVETWIPLQLKWDLPDTQRDGTIRASCLLRSVDARSISARKVLVRVSVGVLGEAMVPGETEAYIPAEIPEDVEVLKNVYPVELPVEAGEKPFTLEEELTLPAAAQKAAKRIYYTLQPEIMDKKVMAGKVVFRGTATLHMMYRGEDDALYSCDMEIPFSQYSELEREYDQNATVTVCPAVTGLEAELSEDGKVKLKAGITGQYVIYDRCMMEVVEDAYSPRREVTPVLEQIQMAAVLDSGSQIITAEQTVQAEGTRLADVCFLPEHGSVLQGDGSVDVLVPGMFQLLYYDGEGNLQNMTARFEETWDMPASRDCRITAMVQPSGKPQVSLGGSIQLRGDISVSTVTTARQGMQVVKALEMGPEREPDPGRPSLILQRTGDQRLWDVAKQCGTTVKAISDANGLQGEPSAEKLLLIPIP